MRNYSITGLVMVGFFAFTTLSSAQNVLTAIFQSQEQAHQFIQVNNWADLQSSNQEMQQQGFQLQNIEMSGQGNQHTFYSVFIKGGNASIIQKAASWDTLLEQNKIQETKGMSLVDVEVSEDFQGNLSYVGIWAKTPGKHQVWKLNSWRSVLALEKNMNQKNRFIQDLEVIQQIDGKKHFVLIFKHGYEAERSHLVAHKNTKAFAIDRVQRNKSGYNLKNYTTFSEGQSIYHVGIFKKGHAVEKVANNLTLSDIEQVSNEMKEEGLVLTQLDVTKVALPIQSNFLSDSSMR